MGGDDVIGRPLGGACVPTQRMLSDLKEASEDASLPQASRSSEETRREEKRERKILSPHSFSMISEKKNLF